MISTIGPWLQPWLFWIPVNKKIICWFFSLSFKRRIKDEEQQFQRQLRIREKDLLTCINKRLEVGETAFPTVHFSILHPWKHSVKFRISFICWHEKTLWTSMWLSQTGLKLLFHKSEFFLRELGGVSCLIVATACQLVMALFSMPSCHGSWQK